MEVLIEWQCGTWGSGRGRAHRVETATFTVVATAFGLAIRRNYHGRDELIVDVPLDRFGDVARVIAALGEEPGGWPWLDPADHTYFDVDFNRRIALAAQALGLRIPAVAGNNDARRPPPHRRTPAAPTLLHAA